MRKHKKNATGSFANTIIILCGFALVFFYFFSQEKPSAIHAYRNHAVEKNYGADIHREAALRGLPAEYFKALAILETSGRKNMPHRFEPHVFERLKQVREGTRTRYAHITQESIADASDEALKNLATSWGPFQIMGYKCIQLNITVHDLRGENAVYWGIKWIDMTYGNVLRQERFEDAFHYHNTGKLFPKNAPPTTHDPRYVERGLYYMEHFRKNQ